MSTELSLEPTVGKLVTKMSAVSPVRSVKVTSQTKNESFPSSFIDVQYAYGGGNPGVLGISFEDIDMVIDALLEHQAARQGRLDEPITIGEAAEKREELRIAFMKRR